MKTRSSRLLASLFAFGLVATVIAQSVPSGPTDWRYLTTDMAASVTQGWRKTLTDLSVSGRAISIAGKSYDKGLGTHAPGEMVFRLDRKHKQFSAEVGVDDEGDGNGYDHADWLNPQLAGPGGETNLSQIQWRSATAGWSAVMLNKSVAGGPLNVGGKDYTDGIGTHATSLIEYDLPRGYTRFLTRAGLDRSGVSPSTVGATVHFLVFTRDPRPVPATVNVSIDWRQLGLSGRHRVRDLWLRQDLGRMKKISAEIPPHGCLLLKVN